MAGTRTVTRRLVPATTPLNIFFSSILAASVKAYFAAKVSTSSSANLPGALMALAISAPILSAGNGAPRRWNLATAALTLQFAESVTPPTHTNTDIPPTVKMDIATVGHTKM